MQRNRTYKDYIRWQALADNVILNADGDSHTEFFIKLF